MLKARRTRPGAQGRTNHRDVADEMEILRWTRDVVAQVTQLEPAMQALNDGELAAQTTILRARLGSGADLGHGYRPRRAEWLTVFDFD